MIKKKEKILLDLSEKESIFDTEKNVGWGGVSIDKLFNFGKDFFIAIKNEANFDYIKSYDNQYLKTNSYFNNSHLGNYHWLNKHMHDNFNNEDFYLPDWNF